MSSCHTAAAAVSLPGHRPSISNGASSLPVYCCVRLTAVHGAHTSAGGEEEVRQSLCLFLPSLKRRIEPLHSRWLGATACFSRSRSRRSPPRIALSNNLLFLVQVHREREAEATGAPGEKSAILPDPKTSVSGARIQVQAPLLGSPSSRLAVCVGTAVPARKSKIEKSRLARPGFPQTFVWMHKAGRGIQNETAENRRRPVFRAVRDDEYSSTD